ncbi:hypothetical protein INT43_005840 [Umbelopsis isabellina]|uniref:BHLH domain-containing protein n=1 Tax=Mortierella isabellina TaxID=91625 RepID=A0A8H7PJ24_MORIS|nr:hypothetical protein INT43_005840 [Umbelopsis isabellina]
MFSAEGMAMAESFLDDMDPTMQFMTAGGQQTQSMAEFEAHLQAAMLRNQQQNMLPSTKYNNMDSYMNSSDLFEFDEFSNFNIPIQQKQPEPALPLPNHQIPLNFDIKQEYASPASSYDTETEPRQSTSLSPIDQAATLMSIPSLSIPQSSPLASAPAGAMASVPPPASTMSLPSQQPTATMMPFEDVASFPAVASATMTAEPTSINASAASTPNGEKPEKKVAHNAIERRYRNNINDRIAELKSVVPALVHAKVKSGSKRNNNEEDDDDEDDNEILDGVAVATKLNKATILRKATEYIVHLKNSNQQVRDDNAALRQIIIQLPGGQEHLMRYQLHAQYKAVQENNRIALEKAQQKQDILNATNNRRKRRRTYERRSQDDSDSSGPVTPPNSNTGRIFMAAFMAVSLFATSPLTTGSVQRNVDDHHHVSKTATANLTDKTVEMTLFGFMATNTWQWIRTIILVVGITYLCLPILFKSSRSSKKHVARQTNRSNVINFQISQRNTQVEMYKALVSSLSTPPPNPASVFQGVIALTLEGFRFLIRRLSGHDIFYDGDKDQDLEWTRACTWLRMSELECVGRSPLITRISMLHSCLKTINLAETLETGRFRSYSRLYATAAVQVALAAPQSVAYACSRYFWHLAFDYYDIDDDDQDWFQMFFSDLHQGDVEDSVVDLLHSDVWNESLNIMRLQTQLYHVDRIVPKIKPTSTVPLEIIANFHILRSLQPLYSQLVHLLTNPAPVDSEDDVSESGDTRFDEILAACVSSNNPTRWYALVGACIEAIWDNNLDVAQALIGAIKELPHDSNTEDQIIQRGIAYALIANTQLRRGDRDAAVRVLVKARSVQMERTNLIDEAEEEDFLSIENNIMILADFVTSILTLQAWIKILEPQQPMKVGDDVTLAVPEMNSIVLSLIKQLRRMVVAPPMVLDNYNQEVLDRLCRVSQIFYGISTQDSGCECSDDESHFDGVMDSKNFDPNPATQALQILHGLM